MGDVIEKLPMDETLDYSPKDVNTLKRFFDTTVQKSEPEKEGGGGSGSKNIYMFIAMIVLLFFICSHPSSIGRYLPENYRMVGTSLVFGASLFVYLYFFK